MSFTDQFTKYEFPNFGFIRLPEIKIEAAEKQAVGISAASSNFDFLKALVVKGLKEKKLTGKEYSKRAVEEISLISELGFIDYFLLCWRMIQHLRSIGSWVDYGRGCLTGEALILSNEFTFLKDIKVGDRVLNSNGKWVKVEKTFQYSCDESLIQIKSWMGSHADFKMTKDHKILVVRNPFESLRKTAGNGNRYVCNSKSLEVGNYLSHANAQWIEAKHLKVNDYVLRAVNYLPEEYIESIDLAEYSTEYTKDRVCVKKALNKSSDIAIKTIRRETGLSSNLLLSIFRKEDTVRESSIQKLRQYLYSKNLCLKDFYNRPSHEYETLPRYLVVEEDFLYLLGYYIGDGWTTKSSFGLAFHADNNLSQLSKIEKYLDSLGIKHHRLYHSKKKLIQLNVQSKILSKYFVDNVAKGAANKNIPNWALFLPASKLIHLLNGLIDSDGSRCENGRWNYDSINLQLIYQVRYIAEKLGFSTSITTRKKCGNNSQSYKLRGYLSRSDRSFNDGKYLYTKVKNIQQINAEFTTVYDLEVSGDDPSYHTDNYIVHNSVGGSLVSFGIGLTNVNPVQHGLLFSRFLNRARASSKEIGGQTYILGDLCVDVDINVEPRHRQSLVDFLNSLYPNRVSKISTFNCLTGKLALKETYKVVSEASEDQAKAAADLVSKRFGFVYELDEVLEGKKNEDGKGWELEPSKEFKAWVDKNRKVYDIALQLRDLVKNVGSHPSGYLIGHQELAEVMPLELSKDGELTCCYDMKAAADLSVKVDILSSRCSTVISETLKTVGIDADDVDVNSDPIIYDNLQDLRAPKGLFQIEAHTNYSVSQKVKPKNLTELSHVLALARPGSLAFLHKYAENEDISIHPLIDPIIKETRFTVLFQEQVTRILINLGFTDIEAEKVRKVLGKKLREEREVFKAPIYEKAASKGLPKDVADTVWQLIVDGSSYGFNACLGINQEVRFKDSKKKLKDVEIGDRVEALCLDTGENQFVEVMNKYNNEVELFEVKFGNGSSIECSMDHKILCADLIMRPLREILNLNCAVVAY